MRACMLAYTFYETDNRVRRYAETLARNGYEVDAYVLRQPRQPVMEVIQGVRVYRIQKRVINEKHPLRYLAKLLLFFLRSAWTLTTHHLRTPYTLIHVHSVPDFEVFATLIPRLMGARIILDIHDIVPEFYASKFKVSERSIVFRLLLALERLSTAYAHHVIIANHLWAAKITQRSVAPQKCTAIINFPDLTIFSKRAHKVRTEGTFVMCYPGTLNWHQGVDIAIEAMARLRDQLPNLKFVIIGDGPDREKLKKMIHDYCLEDRVAMTGLVPMEQVALAMSTVDLGIVPKRCDSFGNEAFSTKIMEFMAMGVPVIASRTRIDEVYFNDGIIQFFESGNVADLAASIVRVVNNAHRREEMRRDALEFIGHNNWDKRKQQYLDVVRDLVDVSLLPEGNGTQTGKDIPPIVSTTTDDGWIHQ